jgi:hypothetical protein
MAVRGWRRSRSRSASAEAGRAGFLAAMSVAAMWAAGARAQSVAPPVGDPKKCVVMIDDMGNVGFRISDAQVVTDAVLQGLRKRVGFDGAHYAGVAASHAAMKKLLSTPEGAGPQEAQLAFYKACEEEAPWRVRARFGTDKGRSGGKGGRHWVTLSCRRSGEADKKPVEEQRFEGATFLEARDAVAAAMPAFCMQIPSSADLPLEGIAPGGPPGGPEQQPSSPPGLSKKKEPKPWTPPPRRD